MDVTGGHDMDHAGTMNASGVDPKTLKGKPSVAMSHDACQPPEEAGTGLDGNGRKTLYQVVEPAVYVLVPGRDIEFHLPAIWSAGAGV